MNDIIKRVIRFKKTNEQFIFEEIIKRFENYIKKNLTSVPYENRDDLKQEIYFAIFLYICRFEIDLNIKVNTKYANNFCLKYYGSKLTDEEKRLICLNQYHEYCLFCNENQFISYCTKIIRSKTINFQSSKKNYISLNMKNDSRTELIDTISDDKNINLNFYEQFDYLTKDEYELLKYIYIEKLTEKQIASIYNISQQAISKRKNKLLTKIKKNSCIS